jgi:uncharacterized protein YegP (UPF0339 family)
MAARFELFQDAASSWRWRLKDGNNVKVATSGESFASKASARRAAENVRETAPGATITDASGASALGLRVRPVVRPRRRY